MSPGDAAGSILGLVATVATAIAIARHSDCLTAARRRAGIVLLTGGATALAAVLAAPFGIGLGSVSSTPLLLLTGVGGGAFVAGASLLLPEPGRRSPRLESLRRRLDAIRRAPPTSPPGNGSVADLAALRRDVEAANGDAVARQGLLAEIDLLIRLREEPVLRPVRTRPPTDLDMRS